VGTSSPRRAAQIRRFRPDLEVVDLRGNIDSRINRVRSGELDGAVLAAAGILRIGRANEIDGYLDQFLPAPAQGALAVEVRSGDLELIALLRNIDDPRSRRRVEAERAVLLGLAATCASAVAALATESEGDRLTLLAELGSVDKPEDLIRVEVSAVIPLGNENAATDLGLLAARIILARGGSRLLEHESWKGVTATPHTVWITRPATGARVEADALRACGLSVIESPLIDTRTDPSASAAAKRVLDAIAGEADLLALTSAAAVRALVELTDEQTVRKAITAGVARGLVVATVGLGTAGEIQKLQARIEKIEKTLKYAENKVLLNKTPTARQPKIDA
jgi:hydroxymethylbilane synthase